MLSYEERLEVIHLFANHHMSIKEITNLVCKDDSSIRKVVREFKERGRINKLLTESAKLLILKKRRQNIGLNKMQP